MDLLSRLTTAPPRPGLHPIPGTTPLTPAAAICPPLLYYLALLFLPPAPPPAVNSRAVVLLRNALALLSALLFLRLPLAYHVPLSIGLTYQLGLVGLYGAARVVDAFFISPYWFGHIPRRVRYKHESRVGTPIFEGLRDVKKKAGAKIPKGSSGDVTRSKRSSALEQQGGSANAKPSSNEQEDSSYFLNAHTLLTGPPEKPVFEHAIPDDGWPHTLADRASWALELELSMRGVGFTWTTADVRHTRKTWLPTVRSRLHSIFVHIVPILLGCFVVVRGIMLRYGLMGVEEALWDARDRSGPNGTPPPPKDFFDERLPLPVQLLLTGCLGAFLMSAFSFAHSAFAILCTALFTSSAAAAAATSSEDDLIAYSGRRASPLAYFPPLYTVRVWEVTSVRMFWSYGWHRLFARFFLVYGVWPGEWVERKVRRLLRARRSHQKEKEGGGEDEVYQSSRPPPADVGKVLGGFLSSAFCHSFAVRGVLGGDWYLARGEAVFFALNGVAVVLEEGVKRVVLARRRRKQQSAKVGGKEGQIRNLSRWYDGYVGRVWWISVSLFTGRNFARGWVNAGLVREMSAM